jgi:hypothetical protein
MLYNRLSVIVEPEIVSYQMGFRTNRLKIDSIFIVRQVYEKYFEYSTDIHNIFIDFSYAFNMIKQM